MSSYRALGVIIGMVLVGAIATAIVKGADTTDNEPIAQAPAETPSPTETMTFPGLPPLATETPVIPTSTATSTAAGGAQTPGAELPKTGGRSFAPQAALLLLLAVAGGWSAWRTARRPSA